MTHSLKAVDKIEISVLINNEVDYISPSRNPNVKNPGLLMGVPTTPLPKGHERGDANEEIRMDSFCCGSHGLSLVIGAYSGDKKHTILFDTGPEEDVFEMNVMRMRIDPGPIEHIHLSHWHRDHSGGMLRAIRMVNAAKRADEPKVTVELHPDRPDLRGINANGIPISLEADPTFEEIEKAGGLLSQSDAVHTVLDDMFLISGEVPRVTDYELGLRGAIRFDESTGKWEKDEMIRDERFVMCNLKGKGLVVFVGCSHPGIINVCKHAVELGGGIPLLGVVGGYHLSDGDPVKMQNSIDDLKGLKPSVLMPGHCTGWRFNFLIEKEIPGSLSPCFSGSNFTLEA